MNDINMKDLSVRDFKKRVEELELINASVPGGIVIMEYDQYLTIIYANQGFYEITGYSPDEINRLFQNKAVRLIHPQEILGVLSETEKQIAEKGRFNVKAQLVSRDGYKWIDLNGRYKRTSDGRRVFCSFTDISRHIQLQRQLEIEQEFNNIISNLSDSYFYDLDLATSTIRYSASFAKRFGISQVQKNYPYSIIEKGIIAEDYIDKFLHMCMGNNTFSKVNTVPELKMKVPSGECVWISFTYSILFGENGLPKKAIGKMTDITLQKLQIELLTEKASTDPLTKLLNKEETKLRIEDYLLNRPKSEQAAFMLIDIDNFKGVNDTLGHQFGDSVLVDISRKLKRVFGNTGIIGRFGGDEFVAFISGVRDMESITAIAESIADAFRHTFSGEHKDYKISGSVGIALCPRHAHDFDSLYHMADIALYESKQRGKDCFTVYSDSINPAAKIKPKEEAQRFIASFYADDPIYNIFEMLYETKDMYTTVNKVLSVIGLKFDVDRCYIFEVNDDESISNTYEWCADGVNPEIDSLQNIPMDYLTDLMDKYFTDGIFYCNDIKKLEEPYCSDFSRQGIQSIIHYTFYDQGKITGFIGFDSCKQQRDWTGQEIATLDYASKILSIFLGRRKIKQNLN